MMMQSITVVREDIFPKVEVQYFCGQYSAALKSLGAMFQTKIEAQRFSEFYDILKSHVDYSNSLPQRSCTIHPLSIISNESTLKQNHILKFCSYLLYYTKNYQLAADYFNWLATFQQDQIALWKILEAHCRKEIGDYQASRRLLDEVFMQKYFLYIYPTVG